MPFTVRIYLTSLFAFRWLHNVNTERTYYKIIYCLKYMFNKCLNENKVWKKIIQSRKFCGTQRSLRKGLRDQWRKTSLIGNDFTSLISAVLERWDKVSTVLRLWVVNDIKALALAVILGWRFWASIKPSNVFNSTYVRLWSMAKINVNPLSIQQTERYCFK